MDGYGTRFRNRVGNGTLQTNGWSEIMTPEEIVANFSGVGADGRYMCPRNVLVHLQAAILSGQVKEDKDNPGYYDVTGIGYPGGELLGEVLHNPFGL